MKSPESKPGYIAEREGGKERRIDKAKTPEASHEELIEFSNKEISDAIHEAEMESDNLFKGVEDSFEGSAPLDVKDFMTEAQRKLAENSAEMRRVAEEARAEAAEVAELDEADMMELSPEEDLAMKVAELIKVAGKNPDAAMDVLVEAGDQVTFEQKMAVVRTALEADPTICGKLDAIGLSDAEKRAAVLPFSRENPMAFFAMIEGAGIDFSREERTALTQDIIERDPKLFSECVDRFGLSHDGVVDIVGSSPPEQRMALLGDLKIPTEQGTQVYTELTAEEMSWITDKEATREARETFEKVEKVNKASRELMFAITEAFPDRVEAERERFAIEQQLQGRIMRVGEIGAKKPKHEQSINKPLYVTIEGKPLPAAYKPQSREGAAAVSIDKGEGINREVLAALIDRALQLDIVPATVLRDGPEGLGSVQDWRVGKTAAKHGNADGIEHMDQLMRVALLDWLTGNADRHMGNWVIGADGKHQAIDNGAMFPKRLTKYDGLRSVPSFMLEGQPLSEELRQSVTRLAGSPEVLKALKKGFDATLNKEDAARAWNEFSSRLEQAHTDKNFTIQPTEWLDEKG